MRSNRTGRTIFALTVGLIAASATAAAPAGASTGGAAPPGSTTTTTTTTTTGVPGRAKLMSDGTAVAPSNAPPAVVNAIAAANAIHTTPYIWGGGHKSFSAAGYDCSGAVSYLLHGAGLLASPLPSGPLMAWGAPGRGAWISVFANRGHAYAVVAGLRWDTSAVGEKLNSGSGPRWRASKRSPRGYAVRHYVGY